MLESATLAKDVMPYVGAVVGAYGHAVWEKLQDETVDATADATVGLGRRLLRRLRGREESRPSLERAVADLADRPGDEDAAAAVRLQIRIALEADQRLAADLATMLPATAIVASGERSVATYDNSGVIATGDNAQIER
jgi:hypothetical protein